MLKVFSILFILLFVSCASSPRIPDRPYLWLAKKDGHTIHLFGTIHYGADTIGIHPEVVKSMMEADVVFVEATFSLNERVWKEFLKERGSLFKYVSKEEAGTPYNGLKEKVSAKAWENLEFTFSHPKTIAFLERNGLSSDINKASPELVNYILLNLVAKEKVAAVLPKHTLFAIINANDAGMFHQDNDVLIVDNAINKTANAYNKPVLSLDELENSVYLLSLIYNEKRKSEFRVIEQYFGNGLNEDRDKFEEITNLYLNSDTDKLMNKINSQRDLAVFQDEFLKNRNEKWLPKLLEQNKVQNLFVAVGLAHLVDKNNVLELLEKKGYKVTRVTPKISN